MLLRICYLWPVIHLKTSFQTRLSSCLSTSQLFQLPLVSRLEHDMSPPSGLEERPLLVTTVGFGSVGSTARTAVFCRNRTCYKSSIYLVFMLYNLWVDLIRFTGLSDGWKAHKPVDSQVKIWPSSYRWSEHELTQKATMSSPWRFDPDKWHKALNGPVYSANPGIRTESKSFLSLKYKYSRTLCEVWFTLIFISLLHHHNTDRPIKVRTGFWSALF